MSARLAFFLRWIGLVVLLLAILLIIARWKLPMREHRSSSTLDILRSLWARWRERREDAREQANDLATLRHKTALLVGPEDKSFRIMQWRLAGFKCAVLRARTGAHALALVQDKRPDMLIVDALLPDMSASDFYHSLANREMPVAFVGVQGHQWDELRRLGRTVTCASNQFDPEEVAATLGYMLRRTSEA